MARPVKKTVEIEYTEYEADDLSVYESVYVGPTYGYYRVPEFRLCRIPPDQVSDKDDPYGSRHSQTISFWSGATFGPDDEPCVFAEFNAKIAAAATRYRWLQAIDKIRESGP